MQPAMRLFAILATVAYVMKLHELIQLYVKVDERDSWHQSC